MAVATVERVSTMTERSYTVQEIDALRRACGDKYIWGRYGGPRMRPGRGISSSRGYQEKDKVIAVEEMVRTFMLAGKTAADLIDSEKE